MMHGERFRPDQQFALEREQAGCSRASLIGVLPASAIPPEWLAERRDMLGTLEEESARQKIQAAKDELSALNRGGS